MSGNQPATGNAGAAVTGQGKGKLRKLPNVNGAPAAPGGNQEKVPRNQGQSSGQATVTGPSEQGAGSPNANVRNRNLRKLPNAGGGSASGEANVQRNFKANKPNENAQRQFKQQKPNVQVPRPQKPQFQAQPKPQPQIQERRLPRQPRPQPQMQKRPPQQPRPEFRAQPRPQPQMQERRQQQQPKPQQPPQEVKKKPSCGHPGEPACGK